MANIVMYTTAYCPYCVNAERLLASKGVTEINKIRIDEDPDLRMQMMEKRVVAQCRKFILMHSMSVDLMICVP